MISIGSFNLTDSVLNLEFRLGVMERVVDIVGQHLPPGTLTEAMLERIRAEVLADLQKRFPDAGITKK